MAFSKSKTVYVAVPPKLDLKGVLQITEKTLGLVGCPRCHSGFDIRFIQEQVILVDKKLEATQFN
jgi:hypothetical protein